ncbi:MAG TPA: DNA gyrase inhibitor YacG [Gammaproteobacteria bacterium]|nr:DNA gyrase inhibitor YacG [Gammaproteobacteria bacterium]
MTNSEQQPPAGSVQAPLVKCPTCGKPVAWTADAMWKPFCSERCKLIDLGAWVDEAYRIPDKDQSPQDEPDES